MNLPNKLTISRFVLTVAFLAVIFSEVRYHETLALLREYTRVLAVFDIHEKVSELATGILVATSPRPSLVTAAHVVQRFLDYGANGRFQVGMDGRDSVRVPLDADEELWADQKPLQRSLDAGIECAA